MINVTNKVSTTVTTTVIGNHIAKSQSHVDSFRAATTDNQKNTFIKDIHVMLLKLLCHTLIKHPV